MITREVFGDRLSLLGFGAMRLPVKDGALDREAAIALIRRAYEGGVNYFDTAFAYHDGLSEPVLGEALSVFPRDSYFLADKYPGHQIMESYDPGPIFEEQLRRCGVEYFDYYLLHNIYENCMDIYMNPDLPIKEYFVKQKELGRIKHLGFSTHGNKKTIERFLKRYGDAMEFCQMQLNYVDWTLQDGKSIYEMLTARGLPVWVMEPIRGGKLANPGEPAESRLRAIRPEDSMASWGFRYLESLPNVKLILSGMSAMPQLEDNLKTFGKEDPVSPEEKALLEGEIADGLKNSIPCTACRYCVSSCPKKLDIPMLIGHYNDLRFVPRFNVGMTMDAVDPARRPSACIACGRCMEVCPQGINIAQAMKEFAEALDKLPKWVDICEEREQAMKKLFNA